MKYCPGCKQKLAKTFFSKNSSRSDGLQNHCRACSKNRWGKEFPCIECGVTFRVNHRNVSKRKTHLCVHCAMARNSKNTTERNKKDATYVTYSTKGYKYIFDHEKQKYEFEHRMIMAAHIGRQLSRSDVVHHINNVNTDNRVENLFLTDNAGHRIAHLSLEDAAWAAFNRGFIVFDHTTGKYKIKE